MGALPEFLSFLQASELVREYDGGSIGRARVVLHELLNPPDGRPSAIRHEPAHPTTTITGYHSLRADDASARRRGYESIISRDDLIDDLESRSSSRRKSVPKVKKQCSLKEYGQHVRVVMKASKMHPSRAEDTAWAKNNGYTVKSVLKRRVDLQKKLKKKWKSGPRRGEKPSAN
jgi:hypothetical protein